MIYIFISIGILFSTHCAEDGRLKKILYQKETETVTYTFSSKPRPLSTTSPESPRPTPKPSSIKPSSSTTQHAVESGPKNIDDRKEYLDLRGTFRDFIQRTIKPTNYMTFAADENKFCLSCKNPLTVPTADKVSEKNPVQLTLLTACSHLLHVSCYNKCRGFTCPCGTESEKTHYFYFHSADFLPSSPALAPLSSTIDSATVHSPSSPYQTQQTAPSAKPSSTAFTPGAKPSLDDLLPPLSQQRDYRKKT